jgi:iron complex transport system substrate-binding protein
VSLNLCSDELLLLLAAPEQIASLTHLSGKPEESPLWQQAQGYPANDGPWLRRPRPGPTSS